MRVTLEYLTRQRETEKNKNRAPFVDDDYNVNVNDGMWHRLVASLVSLATNALLEKNS